MGNDDLHKKAKIRKAIRKQETRNENDLILILCEGEKTEPNYFKGFKNDFKINTVEIDGCGTNTDKLVEKAIKNIDSYDQIWCVFDKDSFPAQNFNRALQLANKHEKIKIAYSNEAFELWYLLHFHLRVTAMNRDEFKKAISKEIGNEYKKNSKNMYFFLKDKQKTAIKNAKKLMEHFDEPNPYKDNPSTTVYKLVEELNKYNK